MLPMPASPAMAANGVPSSPGIAGELVGSGSSGSSSSSCCMAAPSVVASASSTGLSATRWRSTQPFGPTVVSVVANVAASPVSPTTRVCAAWASSSSWLRSAGATDDSVRPSSATRSATWRATSQLTGPVDCRIRITWRQVDLREIEGGGVEVARLPPNRKGGKPGTGCPGVGLVRRALRGLQVETGRPRGQCMGVHSVAVTGASGLVGRHLLPVLAAHPDVDRVLGLDVREPERRPRSVEFARVDIAGTELKPLLEGIDVVVHLAGVVDPVPDVALMARVNVEGTRHVLDAAASVGAATRRAHLQRHRLRRVGEQPGTAHRGRRAPAQPRLLARGAGRRGRATARRVARRATPTSRSPRCVPRPWSAPAPNGSRRASSSAVRRCACAARAAPVQVVHVDDLAAALALVATQDLPGAYNVAADGWLDADEARALIGRPAAPALPAEVLERWLKRTWDLGIGDVPAGRRALPRAPVGDRQRAAARRGLGARCTQRRRHRRGRRVVPAARHDGRRSSPAPVGCCSWPAPRWRSVAVAASARPADSSSA